jgi:hypothetical protein
MLYFVELNSGIPVFLKSVKGKRNMPICITKYSNLLITTDVQKDLKTILTKKKQFE